ncbi:hypothetical protein EJB05_26180, partial [Eragrostis curvula]
MDSSSRTEEHPSALSSSDLGEAATDFPTLEALSLSEPPPFTPQITGETDDDDDDDAYAYDADDEYEYEYGTQRERLPR